MDEIILGDVNSMYSLPLAEMTRQELTQVLHTLRQEAGSDLALARKLHLAASNHIPRLLDDKQPIQPAVRTCLHIAAVSRRHPNEILEAAGHGAVIPILEGAYGKPRRSREPVPLWSVNDPIVQEVVTRWESFDQRIKEIIAQLVVMARAGGKTVQPRPPRREKKRLG